MTFHITTQPEEDGWIVVECPALPGCVSQGRDESEALANIKEAITTWLSTDDNAISLAEFSLSDWLRPEEEEAWAHLQQGS